MIEAEEEKMNNHEEKPWLNEEQFARVKSIIKDNPGITYQEIENKLNFILSDIISEEELDRLYVNDEVVEFDKDANGGYTVHLG